MACNPHDVTKQFEKVLCEYTGAKYAVAVNSCTMALLLSVAWNLRHKPGRVRVAHEGDLRNTRTKWFDATHVIEDYDPLEIEIPKHTYVSVPMSIIHAGGRPTFRDERWIGSYQLKPLPVWDSARFFTRGLYKGSYYVRNGVEISRDCAGSFVCVSFHTSKILGDTQGGAILHDNDEADAWFRRARFDGRTEGVAPKDDHFDMIAWHCYMSPDVAARLLWNLSFLPDHNDPLENDDYPDLSLHKAFK